MNTEARYSPYQSNFIRLRDERDRLQGKKRKERVTNHQWNQCGNSKTKRPQASKPDHKVCCRCNKEKPRSAFYNNKNVSDGKQGHCIDCHKKAIKKGASHGQAENL